MSACYFQTLCPDECIFNLTTLLYLTLSISDMASPEEMAKLTSEVKHRTEDLQAFMRDLGSWQREVETKDKQLITKAGQSSQQQQQQQANPKRKTEAEKAETRVKVPKQVAKQGADDSSSQRIQEAVVMKDRGNEHFKRGKFDQAIECYSKGMRLDPSNAALAANRAMALLKKGKFEEADRDCTIALDLDPTYVKAMQRRGTARTKLGRLEEALADFERVLTLDGGDKLAAAEVKRLQQAIESRKEKEKEKSQSALPTKAKGVSFEDNLKAGLLKATSTTMTTKKQQSTPKSSVVQQLEPGQILPITKLPAERSKRELVRVKIEEIGDVDVQTLACNNADKASVQLRKEEISKVANKSSELEVETVTKCDEDISARMQAAAIDADKAKPKCLPPLPKTFVQFNNAWRCLGHSDRALYLGRMRRRDYATVFKQSLDPNLLGQILSCLRDFDEECGDVLEHLAGLASVPRMATMAMLLGSEDESLVKTIYSSALENAKQKHHDDLLHSIKSVFTFLKDV